jgi:hypothetical protein
MANELPAGARPNPRTQPTGRGGPVLLAGATLLAAEQWKH